VRRFSAWQHALSLFTVIPAGTGGELDERDAARAVLWMPAVGLLLGLAGAGVITGVAAAGGADSGPRRLLGAALAVALLALLTGGLHLDGLADTADGLGSRRPPSAALDIMRRSDVGPMGVATLVLVLLIQVTALAAVPSGWPAVAALVLAAVTGRVAAVLATGVPAARPGGLGALVAGRTGRAGRLAAGGLALALAAVTSRVAVVLATGSAAARPGGFGALVAGQTTARGRAASVILLGCAVAAAGAGLGGAGLAWRGLAAAAAGLLAGSVMRLIAVRRLGGMTGDVFGAMVEVSCAVVLLALALTA
jgi:adenosylcobinamide-GDP ribazoletransferase